LVPHASGATGWLLGAHRNVSNAQAWHDAKNVLKAIQLGLFSDPPGVQLDSQMYIETKTKKNLPIYHCAHGTNNAEGSIHKNLRDRMPKSGTSIRHAAARIWDDVFFRNLIFGALNRSGKMCRGHYNVKVFNHLQLSSESARNLVPNAPILRAGLMVISTYKEMKELESCLFQKRPETAFRFHPYMGN
jgi:hypothetical protein